MIFPKENFTGKVQSRGHQMCLPLRYILEEIRYIQATDLRNGAIATAFQ